MLTGYVVDYVADMFFDYLIERGVSRSTAKQYKHVAKRIMRGLAPNTDVDPDTLRTRKTGVILFKRFVIEYMDFFRQRGVDLSFVLDF